ncbi:vacuolar protein sorting-associated protein 13C isoform X2 [Rhinatrema bivittatum]|uniref:vacuolar protein sorting-associated protein 13C isoform X2 n=1 Tax=Rhinatrema bivittatum TaxID=194408 RepID=UPI001129D63F|nr:vacuolar protein sorting-associated protein 13C isoform X2 [Rhinatrema bivittatum]
MVLESVVADLLNRFLGDYVENLDRSQLKLGIWGGNVALENLQIKENALSELDVPVKVKAGQIDKLTLKIPWKNLYGEAVVAALEGLYILVVPGASIKYDVEKEEKLLQEAKQKELLRIENALQKAAEKEKLKEEKKDTFLEKLATQVIKNLQVKITNIHIRYEDDITDSSKPVSVGVTLGELSLLTANEFWKPCILNEAVKVIYKLVRLDSLSVYWNVHSMIYYHSSREHILEELKRGIPTSDSEPQNYQYIFRPVSASAKLYINPYAEIELKTPKIDCNMEVQNIAVELTKPQYLSMVELLESVDYMVRNAPYRKYRPDVPLHKNARQWWQYAITGILEVHVRRYTRMWSWSNIKQHRQNLKTYRNLYKWKLIQSKVSDEIQKSTQNLERLLDVFNTVLARQQAQAEVIRSGQKMLGKKSLQGGEKKSGGWFGGFWGRKEPKKKEEKDESSVSENIEDLMSPEEKAKLFTAIGYSKSVHNLMLPKQYVAHVMAFKLLSTSVTIREDSSVPEILKIQIIDLSTTFLQRPGAQAIKIEAKLEHWYVTGLRQQDIVPSLVASIGGTESSLLCIQFETNPEDSPADQILVLQSQAVEIIYDARTINALAEFFQTHKGMDLEQLTSATLMKLEEIKERTATGFSHIIETRKVLDLRIDLKPSYLMVPQTGFYHENSDLLILDFGSLQLNSINQGACRTSSFSSLEEIMDKAYDKFDVRLKNVQLLFGKAGEDWKKARFQHPSTLHILQPMDIQVEIGKAMVEKDRRMAKFKVSGELPLLHVRISDQKIKGVFDLVDSIPFPQSSRSSSISDKKVPILTVDRERFLKHDFERSLLLEEEESESEEEYFEVTEKSSQTTIQETLDVTEIKAAEINIEDLIDFHLRFEVKEVILELTKQQMQEETVLTFNITQLGTEAIAKTYDLSAVSYLKKISLDYYDIQGSKKQPLHLISSSDPGLDLLKVEYIKADKNGPSFQTSFNNTEQTLQVAFSSLDLLLHTQALLSTINFLTAVVPSSSQSIANKREQAKTWKLDKDNAVKKVTKAGKDKDIFDFKMTAKLDAFCVNVIDEKSHIAEIKIEGLDSSIFLQSSQTQVFARLRDFIVTDVDAKTIHKKAVSIMGDEVFSFSLALYPDATVGEAYSDMTQVDGKVFLKVGCIQIVYLHKFLMSLLNFLDNFQTAKETLSAATAQAAEKAASSVKDLAERSFRLSMDINLKAPVIVIPESSISQNAIVADLGLIRVQNKFSLDSVASCLHPPVIDKMDVQLTQLKLSRTTLGLSQPDIQILDPINLKLAVNRNLAASWYPKIPVIEVKGHLDTMNVILRPEDLSVLLKVLAENLGEAEHKPSEVKQAAEGRFKETLTIPKATQKLDDLQEILPDSLKEAIPEDVTNLLINFEIKKVVVTLMKLVEETGQPLHDLHVSQLGMEARIKSTNMSAIAYLKKISMKCYEFTDSNGEPFHTIHSSSETDEHLLKMEYIKADRHGPQFKTLHSNTEQTINVFFSSLDLVLHTQALLSIMNFLTSAVPSSTAVPAGGFDKGPKPKSHSEGQKSIVPKAVSGNIVNEDVCNLKLSAKLNAFNIFVCDEKCNIADIRIQGMDASVSMQTKQTEVFARLRDIIVTDVDPKTIHKRAVSMVGDEVFSFNMFLYPEATEGEAYTDMSKVDGKMLLKVGCIQIVFLHKFFMSLLNFLNNFQTAKEALSAATVHAAEKAASRMKDFAQKSFRLLMDINLKAPVIIIPQSSTSNNSVIADLGLIRVQNSYNLISTEECTLPPVIDSMDVQLTQLKLSRTVLQIESSQSDLEILQPVNLLLSVRRNLAAAWYPQIPAIEIKGNLKPMQVALSQDDLTVLMSILLENLGEASSQPSTAQNLLDAQQTKGEKTESEADVIKDVELQPPVEPCVTLQFDFHFESLSIILYNNDTNQTSPLSLRNDSLRLGQLRLHLMSSSGKMFMDGSMGVDTKLQTCTLDDLREGITKVTSRMIDKKAGKSDSPMIDISYKQDKEKKSIVAFLDQLYVCASMEFLLTVADFFIKAIPQSPATATEKSTHIQIKQVSHLKSKADKDSERPKMSMTALIKDPEIVFVANLEKSDAPALAASFQCDFSLLSDDSSQKMTTIMKDLKVLACPFLQEKRGKDVTTVLQPCSLLLESMMHSSGEQNITLMVEEVVIKISPIILNTVMTIMAALRPKTKEDDANKGMPSDPRNLWDVKTINTCNNWFLGVDSAEETTETSMSSGQTSKRQNFGIDVHSIQCTLECGLGHRTVPLLLAESIFKGTIKNWTSLMSVAADTTLEVHYYNENYAVWEPLIERVDGGKRQWNLELEMKTNPVQDKHMIPGDDFVVHPDPQTAINISSKDTMNITISKCSLGVFSNLAKAFSEGTASTFDYSLKDRAPLTVKNALGVPLVVQPPCNLCVMGSAVQAKIYDVDIDKTLQLEYAASETPHRHKFSALQNQESDLLTLSIVPQGYTEVANIPFAKPGRRLYNVRSPLAEFSDSVLIQIDATEGNKVITVRSPLQIKNHFSFPFQIYKYVMNVKLLEPIGVVRSEEEFHVPLESYRCQLFLKPEGILEGQFKESTTYITWKEELYRSNEVMCMLQCPSTEINFLPLIVNCIAVPDQINFIASHGEKDWDPAYIIHLYPPLTVRNLLPYSLRYLLEGTAETHELAEGNAADVLHSRLSGEIMELVLIKYQGKNWNGHFRVSQGLPEFFLICFKSDSTDMMTVDLTVHVQRVGSRMILSVFSPYWIINKTSRVLQYRAEEIHVKHPADFRDVILFSFKKKNIFRKNKIQLCISTSSWSNSFSLDTVGSYGCVKCPATNMEYLVGISIKMSSFNLTRIVTITPFYTLLNNCSLELEVGEVLSDGSLPSRKWSYISSSECLPFWPENLSGKLCARVVGYERSSKPFFYNKQDNGTLLSLDELNGGIMVDVNISEHSIVITFSDYYEGAAPALIINHTPWANLKFNQSGSEEEMELKPQEVRLFAWADPTGTRKLTWKYAENGGEHDLLKDECGQFPYNQNIQIHWVSFLDGRQRVLLFTDDVALVSRARQAEEMEQPDQEMNVSLHSLGLSLVNNDIKQEISYIGITSSGVVWEMKPKQRWKPFNQKQINMLEQAYQKYLTRSTEKEWIAIDDNFEVNFGKIPMVMRLPVKCSIRRNFLSGIQIEFKQSPHQKSLRAQLYWLQIDNQLPGAMFPAVFHPVAPPKSIALDSEPRPFIDVSIITRFNEYSKVTQFKYFMVLIQEMALKVDQGFLGAVFALFTPATDQETEKQRTKLIQNDLDALNTELLHSSISAMSTFNFFEHFHISPVKLHLSLSLGAGGEESNKEQEILAIHSVNLLLKSIGATLTDVDDLIFKLACFEVRYQFYKRDQLMRIVVRHYSEQFLKQMYVLLLGLDVLGNPFGLIRGLSEGVEAFFYEPFQGAVQGPEEFAEGFVIGVRSLLGHTVGGAAGVVSRITGSVGKGLAAITMDKEYQQKRREEMSRQPKDFSDSLAKGGKGLLRGVLGGVTGIITKPVEGAKKEGTAGFFKGIGKGLVGVVARPTVGIIDMASNTFQGIQRVAESTEDVSKLRPTRLIQEDGIIRPYDRSEAEGFDLFENSSVKKLDGEIFRYSCTLPEGKKSTLVVTNRRVMCVKEVEILGQRTTDWDYLFEDFMQPPSVEESTLKLCVKDHGPLVFQKKDSANQGYLKKVQLQDSCTAKMMCNAIDEAQLTRQQQKLVKQKSVRFIKQYSSP